MLLICIPILSGITLRDAHTIYNLALEIRKRRLIIHPTHASALILVVEPAPPKRHYTANFNKNNFSKHQIIHDEAEGNKC